MTTSIFRNQKLSKLFVVFFLSFTLIACSGGGSSNSGGSDDNDSANNTDCPTDQPRCEAR